MNTIEQLPRDLCTGCEACVQGCPVEAITMENDEEGFLRPVLQTDMCTGCGLCAHICPALTSRDTEGHPVAYAARAQDDMLRENSSSGGVFSLLAMEVLAQGGVVFGAALDENYRVVHRAARSIEELASLRGSKYVQSRIDRTFQQAKKYLDAGTTVLFCGTPCQVEGLHAYLRRSYEHLITQDLICHGVPSPMVWERYVREQERIHHSQVCGVNFRYKSPDWRCYSLHLRFQNGETYTASLADDPYMQSFLNDLTLRPSCYRCYCKTLWRSSDITLADFWGVEHCAVHMDDNRGTSLVVCHTEKGRMWLNRLQGAWRCELADLPMAVKYNSAMIRSVPRPAARDVFMRDVMTMPFEQAVRRHCPKPTFWMRVIGKCNRLLRGK